MSGLFAVGLEFEFSASDKGEGTMVPLTDLITAVYFRNPANLEALIKVINGCPINGNFWVFIGGLTDQRVIVTVTHIPTGFSRFYINRSGVAFLPVQDTEAFPFCNGVLLDLSARRELRQQLPPGAAAVADPVLLLALQLAVGAGLARGLEDRVPAEAMGAAGRAA